MFDISIVIVSWNARSHILRCLESVEQASAGLSVETIVVDNASSDGSPQAVGRQFPQVRLVQSDVNLGFAKGNNIGIAKSAGRYLCLVNSDVILHPECLRKMVSFMDHDPEIGMAGPRVSYPDGTFQASCRPLPSLRASFFQSLWLHKMFPNCKWFPSGHLTREDHERSGDVEVLVGCFWMVRRLAIERVGLLDERFFMYGEDTDWCKRFREAGWRVVYCAEAEAVHVRSGSSSNDPVQFLLERERSQLRYWKKHRGRFAAMVYAMILCLHFGVRLLPWGIQYLIRPSRRPATGVKILQGMACLRWLFHAAR